MFDDTEEMAIADTTAARLAAIVESSDDIIISKNLDGTIISWNASAERLFGYTEAEAIGQHISLIIPPDRLFEEDEIIRKIKAGEPVRHFETIRRAKDGSLLELSVTISPVKNARGQIVGASKVARDISERKRIERQLREERETLRTLNQLAPALASNQDLESLVQYATDEATRLTGAAFGAFFYNVVDEEGGAYMLYTLSGADKESFAHLGMPRATAVFSPTFKGEETIISGDITQDPRYGRNKPYAGMPPGHLPVKSYLSVPVIARNGEVIGGLFFGHPEPGVFAERDAQIAEGIAALAAVGIDNIRLYDRVKLGQRRAEEASRAKTDFLATMSHEIRTPMNVIVGIANILAMSSPLTGKQAEFIKTLQSSADALLALIDDLLDISKIEAQALVLEEVPFSLAALAEDIAGVTAMQAAKKRLSFFADTRGVDGKIFLGDPTRLRQIVSNLCSNAVKFTEEGSVSLAVKSEPADASGRARVSITVADTGIGIPAEMQSTIFEKFVQADSSINRRYGGTGLGLSITQNLVGALGGTISLESTPGAGSTFTVSLPLRLTAPPAAAPEAPLPEAEKQDAAGEGKRRVLLVEDHEPNIIVASAFLDLIGCGHDVARNGLQALEKLRAGQYDAAVMDVQMPGMNGYELAQEIRRLEQAEGRERLFIVGVTAHAMAGDRERCLRAGMDEYLAKPFDLAQLKSKLDALGRS